MLNAKFSTNPESFKGCGRGHPNDWRFSHGYTHIEVLPIQIKPT
jgi:hypothetical protein